MVQAGDMSENLSVLSIAGAITDLEGNAVTDLTPLKNLSENNKIIIKTANISPNSATETTCQKPSKLYRICPTARTASDVTEYGNDLVCEGIISENQTERSKK